MLEGLLLSSVLVQPLWKRSLVPQPDLAGLEGRTNERSTPLPFLPAVRADFFWSWDCCGLWLRGVGGRGKNLQAPQELWKPLIKSYCQCSQTQFTWFPGPSFVIYFCSNFANTVCRLVWPSCQPGSPWPTCCPAWGEIWGSFLRTVWVCGARCFSAGPGPADWRDPVIVKCFQILWESSLKNQHLCAAAVPRP